MRSPVSAVGRGEVDEGLSIAEVARRTGLSKDTLRYYEKAHLIEAVGRSTGGQRRYAVADLDWLAFLLRLRTTGMSIADMQRFAELRRSGTASVAARLELLTTHRDDVRRHIADLGAHLRAPVSCAGNQSPNSGAHTRARCVVVVGRTASTTVLLRLASPRLDHRTYATNFRRRTLETKMAHYRDLLDQQATKDQR
jgi:DNA-binding transcriptional MerR regulator